MGKIAWVLAVVAIGEGAVTLHLVRQLHTEREEAQVLQARVAELEQQARQPQQGATFVAIPTQPPTVSPFTTVHKNDAPQPPQAKAVVGSVAPAAVASGAAVPTAFVGARVPIPEPDRDRLRQQMHANMERQRALLRDPEYREAMHAQQRMNVARSNPTVGRDLNLTAEQVDRLYDTLADHAMRSIENTQPFMWGEQQDPAQVQEFHRKVMEQQAAQQAELKSVLGEAKYREWQEYQGMSGVRFEADRLRSSLASAGVPLDENLTKPLQKALHNQQIKMMQQVAATASAASPGGRWTAATSGFVGHSNTDSLKMQEDALEMMAAHQKRRREALVDLLTPEQLKVIEDEHNSELQMQRAQLRMMRAQQEAGMLDPAQGNAVGFIQDGVNVVVPASD
jgi:hypothetical protein